MRLLNISLVLIFLLLPTSIGCQAHADGEAKAQNTEQYDGLKTRLQAAINNFNTNPDLKSATWGFYAKVINNGLVVGHHNGQKSLTPASTLKTVTTAAALSILGPDFTFTTILEHDGFIDDTGVLHGNLYITGGGDPMLGTHHKERATTHKVLLKEWTTALRNKGIKSIEGRIIGDASIFSEDLASREWMWEDMGNYFGAGAAGLNFHDNRYDLLYTSSSKQGGNTTIGNTIPEVPEVEFVNRVKAGAAGTGDEAYIFGSPYSNIVHVRGTIPPNKSGFPVRGSAPDPALFCAHNFKLALATAGIKVSEEASTVRRLKIAKKYKTQARKTIYTTTSPPLHKIVYWVNKRSVNLYAEALVKMMGKKQYKVGSIDNGIKAITNFWKKRNIDVDGLMMYDGSGLSPSNKITPNQLTNMLSNYSYDANFTHFDKSLPVAGNPSDVGGLKSFMRNTAAAKKMHAKSGYIGHNRAYTGYVTSKGGQQIAFAIMVNNYSCSNSKAKKAIEAVLKVLAE